MDFFDLRELLTPFAGLYRAAVRARNSLFDKQVLKSYHCGMPVFCIGNVTVGGSGKTPFAAFLAVALKERGRRPVVLTRGYRGRISGPHRVRPEDPPSLVGDEPAMLFRELGSDMPVVVARDRSAGARLIESAGLGNIILLDDGLQHRRLARDLNFLLLDASSDRSIDAWRNGTLLPRGDLREPLEDALNRSACVVLTKRETGRVVERYEECLKFLLDVGIPVFQFSLFPSHFVDVYTNNKHELEWFRGMRAQAVAAVARPEDFFAMLGMLEISTARRIQFPDHYSYTENDWQALLDNPAHPILTTVKDAVKLQSFVNAPQELFALALSGTLTSPPESLWKLVDESLAKY